MTQTPPELAVIFERTSKRYRAVGRFASGYVAGKLWRDPVHADLLALAQRENFGTVLDIGCGRGQLGIALLEAGLATHVLGIDWNETHLRQAEHAAFGLAFRAERSDLSRDPNFPLADTVVLVDVLYQLGTEPQMALLRAATRAARSRILIRTADPARGIRGAVTRGLEVLSRPFWPHSGAHVNARPLGAIARTVVDAGFAITLAPCWRGTPFANMLLIGRRNG